MDPLYVLALTVGLTHSALLTVVYFSSSMHTQAYVSTEIHAHVFFRALLTVIVFAEAAMGVAYVFQQGGGALRRYAALALALTAMAGWALVASYPSDTREHLAGAATFIAATACYSLLFVSRSLALRPVLYTLWAAAVAASVAFGALYWRELYAEAATLEWVAFLLDAVTLLLFYYANPPARLESHTQTSFATHPRDWQEKAPLLRPRGQG